MDRNTLLAFALSMAVFSGWLAWQQHTNEPRRRATMERAQLDAELAASEAGAPLREASPEAAADRVVGKPETPARQAAAKSAAGGSADADAPPTPLWTGVLESELVRAELTNRGATLTSWRLKYFFETPRQEVAVELIALPAATPLALTTPFEELGLGDLSEAIYEVERANEREVRFVLRRGGVTIRKTYGPHPDTDYGFRLEIAIENASERVLSPRFTVVWPAAGNDRPDFREVNLIALADGAVTREAVQSVGQPGFFSKIFGGGDEGPTTLTQAVQWSGMDLPYFAGLLIPDTGLEPEVVYVPLAPGKSAAAMMSLRASDVAPGASLARGFTGFFGPKQPSLLARLGDDLEKAVNSGYSWVAPLTTFFAWALHSMYRFVPNYGLAIILITVLVRLATWPIMARQMKSAERMRELMPRIKELQEKYKDDRQKQSEETFKLYRETGVNPLGGCLPMVLQLPVFIGLFYALQSSIDLRHAPFFLWINDLSSPATAFTIPGVDFPVRVLPILMGASMFAQQRMMPQTGMDPAQAKMMLIMMPGMMLVISYGFPSGLVLYWMVSNLLGIAHQLWVRRRMQAGAA